MIFSKRPESRLFLIFAVFIYIGTSCDQFSPPQVDETSKKAIIAGKFHYPTDTLTTFFSLNQLLLDSKRIPIETNQDGTFKIELDIDDTSNGYLAGLSWTFLLLNPSDSLYIDLYTKDSIDFSGDGRISELINRYLTEQSNLPGLSKDLWEPILSLNTEAFIELMKSEKAIRNAHNEQFIQELDEEYDIFLDFVDANLQYTNYGDHLLWHVFSNPNADKTLIAAAMEELPSINTTHLTFPQVVNTWINTYSYSGIPFSRIDSSGGLLNANQVIKNAFAYDVDTLMQQLMLAEMFIKDLKMMNEQTMTRNLAQLDTIVTTPQIRAVLFGLYENVRQELAQVENLEGDLFIGDHFETNQLLDSILAANKGQVVYVDLWATWCKPCLLEFKTQATFKKELESMSVKSIYICSDSDQTIWKAMIKKYDLEGINVFMNDRQYESLYKRYNIEAFPTYLIYDQEGNLVQNGSKWRPSFPATLEQIRELI